MAPGPIIGKNRLFNFDIYSFGLGGESECAELANACQTRFLGLGSIDSTSEGENHV